MNNNLSPQAQSNTFLKQVEDIDQAINTLMRTPSQNSKN